MACPSWYSISSHGGRRERLIIKKVTINCSQSSFLKLTFWGALPFYGYAGGNVPVQSKHWAILNITTPRQAFFTAVTQLIAIIQPLDIAARPKAQRLRRLVVASVWDPSNIFAGCQLRPVLSCFLFASFSHRARQDTW